MNRPPFLRSNFFSSLYQVEKRLKLDNASQSSNLTPLSPLFEPPETFNSSSESLSLPIYIDPEPHQTSTLQNSETPLEFLSNSFDFPPTQQNPHPKTPKNDAETVSDVENDTGDIELLIELLGLEEIKGKGLKLEVGSEGNEGNGGKDCCFCGGGFYERVVGVKGPKCEKEVKRLDGWIRYFGNWDGGERKEPLRLAHLILGKAAFDGKDGGFGFDDLEFPSTVGEFLGNDPPVET